MLVEEIRTVTAAPPSNMVASEVSAALPPVGARRRRRRALAAAATAVVVLTLAAFWLPSETEEIRTVAPPPPPADARQPGRVPSFAGPAATIPRQHLPTRLRLGPFMLDQPLQEVVAVLGAPTSGAPDMLGTAHTWVLPTGGLFTVSVWDDTGQVSGLYAELPVGSPVVVEAFGGVVLGASTLRDVVGAWGGDYQPTTSPWDDFVVSYVECVGPFPVVVKFDQGGRQDEGKRRTASDDWEQPVTSALIAYADEPPGGAGCPAPSS